MAILLIFLLGVGNFALHKAVLESRHPLLGQMPWFVHMLGGRVSLISEFLILLAVLFLIASDHSVWWGVGYVLYTVVNGVSAWLILTRRV